MERATKVGAYTRCNLRFRPRQCETFALQYCRRLLSARLQSDTFQNRKAVARPPEYPGQDESRCKQLGANNSMTADTVTGSASVLDDKKIFYNRFLLIVAGLGGLLYGVDVGIIAGALPYLEATSGLNAGQLSIVVAAVLLGSVISTLFAGLLADWMGRRSLMALSGVMFVISIPMIALSHGYGPLVFGRLLQGVSAGLIGVVVPLYLAECLTASSRGKGTGIFQWLLTLGIVTAALVGMFFSIRVAEVAKLGDAAQLLAFIHRAWRTLFCVSLPPGT